MYTQLEQRGMPEPPVNISTLRKMKRDGEPIACLTAYDASYAALVDAARTDLVLVGDSLGMVIQGHDTTVPVTVDDIIYHSRIVARGLRRAFLVADMPFMSYTEPAQALDNAVRLMQEGGAMMVKLEGGDGQIEIVEHLARHDIPVCAHLGLKPQSVHKIGGFKLEHPFSHHDVASKIFYFLLQIAFIIFQLIEQGSLFRNAFPNGVGSLMNIAFRLLEAWRNLRLSTTAFQQLYSGRYQIRFDSS